MSKDVSVFVDSDVLISATLSNKGAAYLLIHSAEIKKTISNYSYHEAKAVARRMNIEENILQNSLRACTTILLQLSLKKIKDQYAKYVTDIDDAHIVAGTVTSQSRFLATYNIRHYKREYIKRDLDVIIITPGVLLQYLRSRI